VDSRAAGTDKGTRKCKFEIDRPLQWNGISLIRIPANRASVSSSQLLSCRVLKCLSLIRNASV
jgi:hypothetical protein